MGKTFLLAAINPCLCMLLFTTFYAVWLRQKERKYVLSCGFVFLSGAAAFIALPARGILPDAFVMFVVNILFGLVGYFTARSVNLRYSGKPFDCQLLVVFLSATVISSWFGLVEDSVTGRGLAANIGTALLLLMASGRIWKMSRPEKLDRLIASTLVLAAVLPAALKLVVAFYVEGRLVSGVGMETSYWEITLKLFGMLSWTAFGILFLARIAMDLIQQLTEQSVTDPLTGVLNRRGFFGRAEAALDEASDTLPGAVMIFDIDRFKTINDNYGHSVGDIVIQSLARVLGNAAGESGIVGRLGGEEFAVLLPRMDARAALLFAQGVRTAFLHERHAGIPHSRQPTVSVGMAELCGAEDIDEVLDRADAALYCAKRGGRDRVECSVQPSRQRAIGTESRAHA